jgi:two-component system, chemotaxis family, sensor kinase CheA
VKPAHVTLLARLRALASGHSVGNPCLATAGETARGMSSTLRVPIRTLDRLVDLTGEMTIAGARLGHALHAGDKDVARDAYREWERLNDDVQELVLRARTVSLEPTFTRCARVMRDAAASCRREVRLEIRGEGVEVDARVVQHLAEALVHLVRNAVAHGIEDPAVRAAAGKNTTGTITLAAHRETGAIVVAISDDGAGLSRQRILERARRRGIADDTMILAGEDVDRLIFEPGFSTAEGLSEVAGRGVGLDVVRRSVEGLRGSVAVQSEAGRGTTFVIRLPLSLAIVPAFAVAVGDETFVLPLDSIECCAALPEGTAPGAARGIVELREESLPFVRLRARLRVPGPGPLREEIVVVRDGRRRVGLVADRLLGSRQHVVRPPEGVSALRPLAGTTVMGDGRVAFLIDPGALLDDETAASHDCFPGSERSPLIGQGAS